MLWYLQCNTTPRSFLYESTSSGEQHSLIKSQQQLHNKQRWRQHDFISDSFSGFIFFLLLFYFIFKCLSPPLKFTARGSIYACCISQSGIPNIYTSFFSTLTGCSRGFYAPGWAIQGWKYEEMRVEREGRAEEIAKINKMAKQRRLTNNLRVSKCCRGREGERERLPDADYISSPKLFHCVK